MTSKIKYTSRRSYRDMSFEEEPKQVKIKKKKPKVFKRKKSFFEKIIDMFSGK